MINNFYKVTAPILVSFNIFLSYPIIMFMPDSYTLDFMPYVIFTFFTTLFLIINVLIIIKRKKKEKDFSILLHIIFVMLLPLTIPALMYNIVNIIGGVCWSV